MSYLLPMNTPVIVSPQIRAAYDCWYQIQTDQFPPGTPIDVYLPSGNPPGHRICVQNLPAVLGNGQNITIHAANGELLRNVTSEVLPVPLTYPAAMGAHMYFSVGLATGAFGFSGWIR